MEIEVILWNAIKDSKFKDLLQTYLGRYPWPREDPDRPTRKAPTVNPTDNKAAEQAKLVRLAS